MNHLTAQRWHSVWTKARLDHSTAALLSFRMENIRPIQRMFHKGDSKLLISHSDQVTIHVTEQSGKWVSVTLSNHWKLRLFLRAGQGSVESLHPFPSHQLSQQKKFSFQFTASSCRPLKCVSEGNLEITDITVDMAQYFTHLRGRGFDVWRQKNSR